MTRTSVRRLMRLTASAAIVGCLAAIPASAAAGTVSSNPTVRNGYPVLDMRFRAADGERNRLTIGIDAQAVEFRDAIGITAGVGCVQISLRQARCTLPAKDATRLRVRAADRDDTVILARGHLAPEQPDPILRDEEYIPCCTGEVYGALFGDGGDDTLAGDARLRGGLGDDRMRGSRLRGGPGQDRLTGTHDADAIAGGAGRDVIRGGAGNDSIFAAFDEPVPASDVFVGGPGLDTLDYSEARTRVSVNLGRASALAGRPGEHDRTTGFEDVVAGSGDDVLVGNNRANALYGSGGHDWIAGRDGDDEIDGGPGADSIWGGRGADELAGEQGGDVLRGGRGPDSVATIDDFPGRGDHLYGDAGDDALGSRGAAMIDCGAGSDSIWTFDLRAPLPFVPRRCESYLNGNCIGVRAVADTDGKSLYVTVRRRVGCQPGTIAATARTLDRRKVIGRMRHPRRLEARGTTRLRIPLNSIGQRHVRARPMAILVHFKPRSHNGPLRVRWIVAPRGRG